MTDLSDRLRHFLGNRAAVVDTPLEFRGRLPGASRSDGGTFPVSSAESTAAIERDSYCCRCCGFFSAQHQTAISLTGHPRDIDQLVTVCLFCAQCFQLDHLETRMSGTLIWAPELSQAEFSQIAREIYVAIVRGGGEAERGRACLERILGRATELAERTGIKGTAAFLDLLAGERKAVIDPEDGVRLFCRDRWMLPSKGRYQMNALPGVLDFWTSAAGPYSDGTPLHWLEHARKVFLPEMEWEDSADIPGERVDAAAVDEFQGPSSACPEFISRSDALDRRRFEFYRLDPDHDDYVLVGDYRVLDPKERPHVTRLKVENLVAILNGAAPPNQLGELTRTQILFELQPRTAMEDPTVMLTREWDGEVITDNARLTLSKGVLNDE